MKGHIIATIITFVIFIGLGMGFASAIDREFINDYAKQLNIQLDDIRVANSDKDCYEDEIFDDKYGLCIVFNHRFTDTDVEEQGQ